MEYSIYAICGASALLVAFALGWSAGVEASKVAVMRGLDAAKDKWDCVEKKKAVTP